MYLQGNSYVPTPPLTPMECLYAYTPIDTNEMLIYLH